MNGGKSMDFVPVEEFRGMPEAQKNDVYRDLVERLACRDRGECEECRGVGEIDMGRRSCPRCCGTGKAA